MSLVRCAGQNHHSGAAIFGQYELPTQEFELLVPVEPLEASLLRPKPEPSFCLSGGVVVLVLPNVLGFFFENKQGCSFGQGSVLT